MGAEAANFGCIDKSQKRNLIDLSMKYLNVSSQMINYKNYLDFEGEGKEQEDDPYYIGCEINIGYTKICLIFFSIISVLGLLANLYLLGHFIKQILKGHDTKTILKKMFLILSLIEIPMSIYWIINRFKFKDGYDIKKEYESCHYTAFYYIVVFTFGFTFVDCILVHFMKINSDPIEGILRPNKNFIKYILLSFGCGLGEACFCSALNIIGKSVRFINIISLLIFLIL